MQRKPLKLNLGELQRMGLKGKCYWAIEYDLPHKHLKDRNKGKKCSKETIKLFQDIRNKLMYALKFQIKAIKNLDSSWFISEDRLDLAEKLIEEIRDEMSQHRETIDYINKIQIIPLLTDEEGFETFEDRKAEFLLEFCMEHQRYVEKGLKTGDMYDSTLWRCKKSVEIIEELKEELKGHKQYREIIDTLRMLDDTISRYEDKKEQEKIKEIKKNGDRL